MKATLLGPLYIEVSLTKAAFHNKHFLSVNVVNIMENTDISKILDKGTSELEAFK
jgi:hypothetical protein